MTYLVAFDGGELSLAALRRARRCADRTEESLLVVCLLPADTGLAAEYGFSDGDTYDREAATEQLRSIVHEEVPDAEFRVKQLDAYAGKGRIAKQIRAIALESGVEIVFMGSDDVGRVVQPVTSVQSNTVDQDGYDVFIVRTPPKGHAE